MEGLSPGERIRTLRLRLRLRQKALGKLVDLSGKQIGRYERDEGSPTGTTLRRLALALGTSTDFLVGLTDDPRPPYPVGSSTPGYTNRTSHISQAA